jgi:hypothetical protein
MTTTQCVQFEQLLEQDPDRPLTAAVAAHLDSCAQCRLLWDDLEAIRAAGRAWGADEPAPPAHIWPALRAQLASEGLIREADRPGWFGGWLGWSPRFAAAGAYAALLVVAGSLVSLQIDRPAAVNLDLVRPNVSLSSEPAMAALNSALDGDMDRVVASLSDRDDALATSFRENRGIVDNLISMCEKSLRENPNNSMAREYLYGAYQQKADLLAAAMDRSTLENR